MSYLEALRLALRRLLTNPVRTFLTTLGVIIGVASLVTLIAIGQGTQKALTARINGLGTNLLQVTAGATTTAGTRSAAGSATTLTTDDATALAALPGVAAVAPELTVGNVLVVNGTHNTTVAMTATTTAELQVRDYEIQVGTYFTPLAQTDGLQQAVLGPSTVAALGTTPEQVVGKTLTMGGLEFQVVGVTQAKGGTTNADDYIDVPMASVQGRLVADSTSLRTIALSLKSAGQTDAVTTEVTNLLRTRHALAATDTNDFTLVSQDQLLSVASSQTATLRTFLYAIAAISLIVGGIGIANTMLVSVRERTREIGTRKAIGARRRDIGRQFLVEAVIVSLGGAIIGAIVGAIATAPAGHAVSVAATPSFGAIGLAVASAMVVGIVAGYLPARTASRLDPVDALRYE